MNFVLAQPFGLLALLSLPAIVWMHRHVLRARRREVSSLSLWRAREQVAHEGRVRRRIPDWLLLALELAAALAMTLVLAGFDLQAPSAAQPRVALIIDASASMAGGLGEARPLERVRAALGELAGRARGLRVTLISAGESASLLGPVDQSPEQADALLASFRPSAATAQLGAAEALASALGHAAHSRLIFSDDPSLLRPQLVHVGLPEPNTAFVHASWQPGAKPFVALRQFGPPRSVTLSIEVDAGRSRSQQTIALDGKSEAPLALDVDPDAERVDVSLASDALTIDDRVTLLRPRAAALAVHAGELSPKLQRALARLQAALPSLQPSAAEHAELTIAENPGAPVRGTLLAFHTRAKAESALVSAPSADPFSTLVADFDARGLIWYAFQHDLPPASRVLLRDGARPLLYSQGRTLHVNVDLERSNLLEHTAFPILFEHLVQELLRAQPGLPSSNFQQSQTIAFVREPGWRVPLTLLGPSGQRWSFEGERIELGIAPEPGLYRLEGSSALAQFAVQYAAAHESDLSQRAPENRIPPLSLEPVAGAGSSSQLRDWFLLGTLLCCLGAFALLQLKAAAQ